MKKNELKYIDIDSIIPNPENPRIIFRQEELDNLLVSMKKIGQQVPITVFQKGVKYIIIDGERRWRVAKKLNWANIPAIIQPPPSELENLLLMFNIHALREQWDYFTIANKIIRVRELLRKKNGREATEQELSTETGLTRGAIRRCKHLIDLPPRFKEMLLVDLKKPKAKQEFSEDFFIEMEKSLKSIIKRHKEFVPIETMRNVLIDKYKAKIITIQDFRKLIKIGTANKNVNVDERTIIDSLKRIFTKNNIGIDAVYQESVGELYDEKKFVSNANSFLWYVEHLKPEEREDVEIRNILLKTKKLIDKILG